MSNSNNMTSDEMIEFFFLEPNPMNWNNKKFSQLFLLRKQKNICLCKDGKNTSEAVWAAAMLILAGIDMLGKYYSGEEDSSRTTFKCFCKQFLNLDESKAEALYMFRNSVFHSFGLKSTKNRKEPKTDFKYKAYYKVKSDLLKEKRISEGEEIWKIDISELDRVFDLSIDKYQQKLKENADLKENFTIIFKDNGIITYEEDEEEDVSNG